MPSHEPFDQMNTLTGARGTGLHVAQTNTIRICFRIHRSGSLVKYPYLDQTS